MILADVILIYYYTNYQIPIIANYLLQKISNFVLDWLFRKKTKLKIVLFFTIVLVMSNKYIIIINRQMIYF